MRIVALIAFFFSVGIGLAQMGPSFVPEYMPALIGIPEVAKELKVTPAQQAKIKLLRAEAQKELAEMLERSQNKTRPSLAQVQQKMEQGQIKALVALNSSQKVRLHQLTMQYLGAYALQSSNLVRALKITGKQLRELTSATAEALKNVQKTARQGGSGYRNLPNSDASKQYLKTRIDSIKSLNAKASQILTSSQSRRWKAMMGKPFPLDILYRPVAIG